MSVSNLRKGSPRKLIAPCVPLVGGLSYADGHIYIFFAVLLSNLDCKYTGTDSPDILFRITLLAENL